MNWFDIERIGWEEGDVICGLVVVGDAKVATGRMRVTCDAEGAGGGRSEEEGSRSWRRSQRTASSSAPCSFPAPDKEGGSPR